MPRDRTVNASRRSLLQATLGAGLLSAVPDRAASASDGVAGTAARAMARPGRDPASATRARAGVLHPESGFLRATPLPQAAPGLELAFVAEVLVAPALELGRVDGMRRRIIPITGGHVTGPRLRAEILPGGADWQGIRESGVADVLARYTLRSSDGTIISVTNPGIRRGPAEVMTRLAAGEHVDPQLYYFRTTPSFEVAAGRYDWLRENVFVCTGAREPERVILSYYRVL